MRFFVGFLIVVILGLLPPLSAHAWPLVADIDTREVDIHSAFTGKDLLLFGARNDPGTIILVVRGPERTYVVRQKERVAGVWMNTKQAIFRDVLGFYAIAASHPVGKVRNDLLLQLLQINQENLKMNVKTRLTEEELIPFREALLHMKREEGLYPPANQIEPIYFVGDTLFRSNIRFPDNIPRGTYTAEFYLFNDGRLSGIQTTPVVVRKQGFDAFVYDTAYRNPLLYGLVAIFIALAAGWSASKLFERW